MADTPVTGQMLIADEPVRGSGQRIRAFESAADREIEPAYAYGDASHVDAACAAAAAAIGDYRSTTAEQRARFLETNASKQREGHGRRRRTGRHRERAAAGAPHRRGRPHHRPATPVRRRPAQSPATPMLTPGIADAYAGGVTGLSGEADLIARGETGDSRTACRAALFATDVDSFLTSHTLQAEVFGSSSLIVRCADAAEMRTVAENIGGQLTATVHAGESDDDEARQLLPLLELKAGRIPTAGPPASRSVTPWCTAAPPPRRRIRAPHRSAPVRSNAVYGRSAIRMHGTRCCPA